MPKGLFWEMADSVKRRLFGRLRKETASIDYLRFKDYRKRFDEIPDILIREWKIIKKEIKEEYKEYADDVLFRRLEGFLYEALFYYACLDTQSVFLDAEIIEMADDEPYFTEYPPWFEAIPLYDIIPNLHYIRKGRVKRRKVPQVKADFLVMYVDDKGPLPPALIDVKARKPSRYKDEWNWQIVAAMRMGFIFQIAYPKHGVKYPKSLKEWELRTPCPECKKLSHEYRRCSECGAEIFPFTIVDARYTLSNLIKWLGKTYSGRF